MSKLLVLSFFLLFFSFVLMIVLIGFIIGVGVLVLDKQEYCDSQFGKGNWYLNETTSTGKCENYQGQCWECVPEKTDIADEGRLT